ncbi:YceI family protein [Nocardia carnea]|uniref:YceI family protein n=1 Tax=Nocardia carnea TaxID=37328 RepID=A0ABW7TP52_9NOCA|nr:YceI family protein [Nocardia carnea]
MTSATNLKELSGTYTLDPTHTRVGFVTRHAMVTKVRGSFNEFTGSAYFDSENPANSSGEVTIQVASIDTRNADRDNHLRGLDFLGLDEYPEITFRTTAISPTGADTFDVTGDLTIKGVTRPVTVPFTFEGQANDPFGNVRVGFEGSATINRKDWGIVYNATLETGGVLISDKVVLEFEVSAIKQDDQTQS